jgi:dephospho-CoA kinase
VLRVGLTGGIGSGKSTVARLLAAHGATVVDADAVAREVVAPGTEGLAEVVAAFGEAVLSDDGSLDRAALGRLVFGDDEARARLNAIVHPRVGERSSEMVREAEDSEPDGVLVHDIPLLVENGLAPAFDAVVVVEVDPEVAVRRLVDLRGMSEDDARSRIAAQADRSQRRAVADHVIVNEDDEAALEEQVAALWRRLSERADPTAAP